jgi:hypothetical protein
MPGQGPDVRASGDLALVYSTGKSSPLEAESPETPISHEPFSDLNAVPE